MSWLARNGEVYSLTLWQFVCCVTNAKGLRLIISVTFGVMPLNDNNARTVAFIAQCISLLINIVPIFSELNLRQVAI